MSVGVSVGRVKVEVTERCALWSPFVVCLGQGRGNGAWKALLPFQVGVVRGRSNGPWKMIIFFYVGIYVPIIRRYQINDVRYKPIES